MRAGSTDRPGTNVRDASGRDAVPARRDLGRRGHELLALLRERRARRAVPVRRRRTRGARRARRERTAFNWHGYLPGVGPGPALRLPRPRPVRPERGPPLQPGQAPDRPVREGDRRRRRLGRGERAAVRPGRRPRTPTSSSTTRTTRRRSRSCVVDRPDASTGRATGRRARRGTRRSSTRRTSRASRSATRTCARTCAAPTPGLASRRGDRLPARRSASPRSSCCRSTTSPTSSFLAERGLTNYWGYSSIGYLAPHAGYAATGTRGEQVREFKGMVKALHRAGIEVILDVVYNHTAEGNHLGPMLSLPRRRQRRPTTGSMPDDPRFYMDFTGTGNTLNPVHPSVLRLIMDSLRYWVDRVPRRRLPLRPRVGARARVLRRRPPVGVLRRHPPGPGALAGEADRRAVGRRAGRLPGRQLPGAVVGVERHLPRRDARLLARRRARVARLRVALHRLERPLPGRRPATRSRRSTSSPPTTASRCATSSPTTTSTTRRTARTTATAPTTTARGTAASRAPTDDPAIDRAARRASSATSSRRCCSRRACRCCSAATRSAARRAATTTPSARTTRSPGSTGSSATAASCSRSRGG